MILYSQYTIMKKKNYSLIYDRGGGKKLVNSTVTVIISVIVMP